MFIIKPAKKYYFFFYLLLSFLFINSVSYSQTDSLRRKTDSLFRIPFDTLKIKKTVQFSQQSDTIPYNDFIWNDKRNVSEVLNEYSGFFVNNKGLGQYNRIYYNNFIDYEIGFFRDGIQINNNFFGIFDSELISINEIDKIEVVSNTSSFIYGVNSFGKAINIITKDKFQPKPFSQLRYSQDRSGSLFADASFSIPLSKKFNFLIRANNHSGDGLYTNSDFSSWRANGRMSWFPSTKWNFKLDFAYAKISRGLNEGLNFYGKDLSSQSVIDSLRDTKATVLDPTGREENRNYNASVSVYSRSFGSNSLTSAEFYYTHYYRSFGGKALALELNSPHVDEYYNTERLGLNLKFNKRLIFSDKQSLEFTFLNNYYSDNFDIDYQPDGLNRDTLNYNISAAFLSGKIDYKFNKFFISAMAKEEKNLSNSTAGNFSFGGETKLILIENDNFGLGVFAGGNYIEYRVTNHFYPEFTYDKYSYKSYEAGIDFKFEKFSSLIAFNRSKYYSSVKFNLITGVSKFTLNSENNFKVNRFAGSLPFFSKNDISYSDKLFKNKLDLKIGVNFKFISNFEYYSTYYNESTWDRFYGAGSFSGLYEALKPSNNKFLADFYIGARIGRANINFTVANIFNSFYYDTFMFPSDDRGGLGNVVSRFTIVWDFIN
ncbi:MAG: TonB-dependent receptor plug domain-containing protein [Ignavibacteria bacterium]|nr:TonB-dependent receptor plug domain-containing protein [Ignavibacteria bacterium]